MGLQLKSVSAECRYAATGGPLFGVNSALGRIGQSLEAEPDS